MEQHPIAGTTRRTVLGGLAAALAPATLAAQAQQRDGTRRLGVLMQSLADDPLGHTNVVSFEQGLSAHNWNDGGNLRIDWRWPGGDPALYDRYAVELAALQPEVFVAYGSPAVEALRRQTSTIPIVFTVVADPVGQGFVQSLARPGGTVTGFSLYDSPMAGKWVQMLTQITPAVAHVVVLYNSATAPYSGLIISAIEKAAQSLAVSVRAAPCRDDSEIEATVSELAGQERGGLVVLPESFTVAHRDAIVTLAARHHLPAVYSGRPFAIAGGLMSYGTDVVELFRRTASYVDLVLRGAKPADLPVQNPTKFELVINLKTAEALGITFPTTLLATADEVIE